MEGVTQFIYHHRGLQFGKPYFRHFHRDLLLIHCLTVTFVSSSQIFKGENGRMERGVFYHLANGSRKIRIIIIRFQPVPYPLPFFLHCICCCILFRQCPTSDPNMINVSMMPCFIYSWAITQWYNI